MSFLVLPHFSIEHCIAMHCQGGNAIRHRIYPNQTILFPSCTFLFPSLTFLFPSLKGQIGDQSSMWRNNWINFKRNDATRTPLKFTLLKTRVHFHSSFKIFRRITKARSGEKNWICDWIKMVCECRTKFYSAKLLIGRSIRLASFGLFLTSFFPPPSHTLSKQLTSNIYVSGNVYNQAYYTRPRLITLSLSL